MYSAISTALRDRKSLFAFIVSAAAFSALFIAIPVWTTPSNTLSFQLKILRTQDYILMIFLAIIAGLNIALQVYGYKLKKAETLSHLSQSVLTGSTSGGLGIFGSIAGTATCASCLASLLGLVGLGTGSVFFVLKNHMLFLVGAAVVMLVLLYFSARKINKVCSTCEGGIKS